MPTLPQLLQYFLHLSTHPTSCSLSSFPLFPSLILYPSPSLPTLWLSFYWVQLVLAMYSSVWHLHYIKRRREEKREGDAGKILDMVLWLTDKGSTYMCEFSTFFLKNISVYSSGVWIFSVGYSCLRKMALSSQIQIENARPSISIKTCFSWINYIFSKAKQYS